MVQMGILDPKLAVLDETDSGLDIDALKTVGNGINAIMRKPDKGVLLITHYQRLLDVVQPTHVSILSKGHIVKTFTSTSGLHGIRLTPKGLEGGADKRREGSVLWD